MAINLNTVNAMIRDERKAANEYKQLAQRQDLPLWMRRELNKMSTEESFHELSWMVYKNFLETGEKSGGILNFNRSESFKRKR